VCVCCLHVMDEGQGMGKGVGEMGRTFITRASAGQAKVWAGGTGNDIRLCMCATGKTCMRVSARVGRCRLSLLVRLSARIFTLLARLLARLAHDDRCRSPCSLASPPAFSPLPPPWSPTTSHSPPTSSPDYMPISIPI